MRRTESFRPVSVIFLIFQFNGSFSMRNDDNFLWLFPDHENYSVVGSYEPHLELLSTNSVYCLKRSLDVSTGVHRCIQVCTCVLVQVCRGVLTMHCNGVDRL